VADATMPCLTLISGLQFIPLALAQALGHPPGLFPHMAARSRKMRL
jgi:hypothetical protein